MTQRTYRTAQGKLVDLGALQLKNENVRAVGNMPVNARGDLLDSNNRPINSRNQQVAKQYQKQVTNVQDDVVVSSKKQQPVAVPKPAVAPAAPAAAEARSEEPANTGLAAAIARARQVKQEPIQTQAKLTRHTDGVKKI